jgi:hypothetical protein
VDFEEDHGVNTGATRVGVELLDQLPDEGEIEPLLQSAVEIVLRNEIFEAKVGQWGEMAGLGPHHGCVSSCGKNERGSC